MCVPDRIGIWKCWFFEERGKPKYPEKNLSEQERTNNKLNPLMASTPGVEPGPHWWEASPLTPLTAPPLLPKLTTHDPLKQAIWPPSTGAICSTNYLVKRVLDRSMMV